MSERKWTTEQRQCIDAHEGTLLVSAAAGSGKTAVLIERILARLTDPVNPIDVDRLLVVTFTKAAAAEMKQRLSAALSARIAACPEDIRLQRQQAMLANAHISTVHSFCTALLREHFQQLDISPQFRVPETAQSTLLREEALSAALESGKVAGAALDVFENEPFEAESKFRTLNNVILTPHIAWRSHEAMRDLKIEVTDNIIDYFEGRPLKNQLNLK